MATHKKDLRPLDYSEPGHEAVLVVDRNVLSPRPRLFLDGKEILVLADDGIEVEWHYGDLTRLNLSIGVSDVQVITPSQAEERLIKE